MSVLLTRGAAPAAGRVSGVTPDFPTFRRLAETERAAGGAGAPYAPIVRRLPADLDTPVSAYLKLCAGATDRGYSFLLESVHGGEQPARYSFLGAKPERVLLVGPHD